MVEETNLEGEIVYKCEKCGWLFGDKDMAEKCEDYCRKHDACLLKYAQFAIKLNKLKIQTI